MWKSRHVDCIQHFPQKKHNNMVAWVFHIVFSIVSAHMSYRIMISVIFQQNKNNIGKIISVIFLYHETSLYKIKEKTASGVSPCFCRSFMVDVRRFFLRPRQESPGLRCGAGVPGVSAFRKSLEKWNDH